MQDVKLLIVDDDEDDYLLVRDLLDDITRGPYQLDWAGSYEAGEAMLAENRHDLCLMDYKLGARDGIDLLRRAHHLGFTGPIILLTGMHQGEVDMQALEAGAVDYLVKANLSAEQLARSIRYALARREMEQERVERLKAEADNRSKSEFLAHLSHELRTPLSAILGFTELLINRSEDPDNLSHLQVVHRNGKHLLGLLNDILDLSKIEAGKLELEYQPIHLASFLADIYALMHGAAVDKNLHLYLRVEGTLPRKIQTDPTRLRQVLLNLMGNAIKFTDRGEVGLYVTSVTRNGRPFINFRVQDTGIGISHNALSSIFQPFVQSRDKSTYVRAGTGLGLTISQQLVQRLGGKISVTSELGKGSEFEFAIDPGDVSGVAWEDFNLAYSGHKITRASIPQFDGRILVVDDLRDIRLLIGHFVTNAGLDVVYGKNGAEAIELVEEAERCHLPFDLVLMDIHMPVMNGMLAAQQLRHQGFRVPLVALTAANMKGDKETYLQSGFNQCLSKPIDQTQLFECLAEYLKVETFKPERNQPFTASDNMAESRLLLVDDSEDALSATSGLLQLIGWEVVSAIDGRSALEQARARPVTKALVDVNLPDMNGYDLCRQLREILPDAELYIASGEELDNTRAKSAGVKGALLKPLTLDSLQKALK